MIANAILYIRGCVKATHPHYFCSPPLGAELLRPYLAAAETDGGVAVVDAAKLSGGDALDGGVGVDVVAILLLGDEALHEVVYVAYLELDGHACACQCLVAPGIAGDEVEVGKAEVVAILQLCVPTLSHEDDVLLDVLLDHKPWAAT